MSMVLQVIKMTSDDKLTFVINEKSHDTPCNDDGNKIDDSDAGVVKVATEQNLEQLYVINNQDRDPLEIIDTKRARTLSDVEDRNGIQSHNKSKTISPEQDDNCRTEQSDITMDANNASPTKRRRTARSG